MHLTWHDKTSWRALKSTSLGIPCSFDHITYRRTAAMYAILYAFFTLINFSFQFGRSHFSRYDYDHCNHQEWNKNAFMTCLYNVLARRSLCKHIIDWWHCLRFTCIYLTNNMSLVSMLQTKIYTYIIQNFRKDYILLLIFAEHSSIRIRNVSVAYM